MTAKFAVFNGLVAEVDADILVLKFAGRHHGADRTVANALGRELTVGLGAHRFIPTGGRIQAKEVLVLAVGSLLDFEYQQIEKFGRLALEIIAKERSAARSVALTIHGPGYGLDELAATDALVRGLVAGAAAITERAVDIILVEREEVVAKRLTAYLKQSGLGSDSIPVDLDGSFGPDLAKQISTGGSYAKRLFAAMPFDDAFLDHWELAIQPAAHENNFIIERLDHETFTGDIVAEIRNRIAKCAAVVALLDGANPNVFLEIGYAWGVAKPTILLLSNSGEPPFDVKGHRIVRFQRIGTLKTALTREIKALASDKII